MIELHEGDILFIYGEGIVQCMSPAEDRKRPITKILRQTRMTYHGDNFEVEYPVWHEIYNDPTRTKYDYAASQ